jgi:hypothetical protein
VQSAAIAVLALTLVGTTYCQYQADLLVKQAVAAIQRQDFWTAEEQLKRAIAFDGARGDARVHLGFILSTLVVVALQDSPLMLPVVFAGALLLAGGSAMSFYARG